MAVAFVVAVVFVVVVGIGSGNGNGICSGSGMGICSGSGIDSGICRGSERIKSFFQKFKESDDEITDSLQVYSFCTGNVEDWDFIFQKSEESNDEIIDSLQTFWHALWQPLGLGLCIPES